MKRLSDIWAFKEVPVVSPEVFSHPNPKTIDGKPISIEVRPVRIKEVLYAWEDDRWEPLQIYKDGFYKLTPGRPPGLVINGFRMYVEHFSKYIREAISHIRPGILAWDTCGGLGYSARYLYRRFSRVFMSEKSEAVITLASYNPFSKHIFRLDSYWADAWEMLGRLDGLDAVFHDPPSFSQAPDLYSREFSKEVWDRLIPGGVFYHYTGYPGKYRGRKLYVRVMNQMKDIGFRIKKLSYGILGTKP